MIQHPREIETRTFRNSVSKALEDLIEKHNISDIEYLQFLAEEQQKVLKYMLREERHPDDPTKPAGIL